MSNAIFGDLTAHYSTRYDDLGSAIAGGIRRGWQLEALTDIDSVTYTYREVAERIAWLHLYFRQLGIVPGDKIALVGRNSSNWTIAFLGVVTYGAVIVPILHEFKPVNIHHLVNHSDSKLLFCGERAWYGLSEYEIPTVQRVISLEDWLPLYAVEGELNAQQERAEIDAQYKEQYPDGLTPEALQYYPGQGDELAEINYTSGTTGFSKGVMVPYRSLLSNLEFSHEMIDVQPGDTVVVLLPMAHAYGQMFEFLFHIVRSGHLFFLSRRPTPQLLADVFRRVRPGIILLVPLILEKIYKSKIRKELSRRKVRLLMRMPLVEKHIKKRFCDSLNDFFGNNFHEVIVGGAGLNPEVESFLKMIGFRHTVGYGMTECAPIIGYTPWATHKMGSVGEVVRGMQMRVTDVDPETGIGEIEVRGRNLMLGYYKEPEWTRASVIDGTWFATGDRGYIDAQGFLYIRGRSKNMILGPSGQNIYPEEIEAQFNTLDFVLESLVLERDGALEALLVPDYSALDAQQVPLDKLPALFEEYRVQMNHELPSFCQVARVQIYPEEFEKTPKKSIKRYLYTHVEAPSGMV